MTDRYREGLKHDIAKRLERGKGFDTVTIDARLEDNQKKQYGVDVLAVREADSLVACYLIPDGEGQKYVDAAKHRAIAIQNAMTQEWNKLYFRFYIYEQHKWKEYNVAS